MASSTTAANQTAAPSPRPSPGAAATVGLVVDSPASDVPVETADRLASARVRDLGAASPRRAVPEDLADLDIPYRAYVAYRFAADALERADRSCGLDWTVLAAIGRIESDHGRYAGSKVRSDGTVAPSIRGIALDGTHGTSRLRDTDGGTVDGDARWERAVGPMQFLPSTWSAVGVDADDDGTRSADDIDDATLAAAVYLCAGGPLDSKKHLREAIFRYNHSQAYVDAVLALAKGYRHHDYTPMPTYVGPSGTVEASGPIGLSPSLRPELPAPTREQSEQPGTGAAHHGGDQPSGQPSGQPTDEPTGVRPSGTMGPTDTHHPSPDPTPTPEPTPTPTPTPQGPAIVDLSGVLAETNGVWTVAGTTLDVGDATWLATTALADLDGDGAVETNLDELTGLLGATVTVGVEEGTSPAVVHTVGDLAYRADSD